jgi:hypothetical protein
MAHADLLEVRHTRDLVEVATHCESLRDATTNGGFDVARRGDRGKVTTYDMEGASVALVLVWLL